jgi:hypothetical protein
MRSYPNKAGLAEQWNAYQVAGAGFCGFVFALGQQERLNGRRRLLAPVADGIKQLFEMMMIIQSRDNDLQIASYDVASPKIEATRRVATSNHGGTSCPRTH